ncbi:hypothetical protein FQN49_001195 [Arthroderma sp. PD_2]|nr:hypothetical protein FQN49_001195 [Arthroderma sp. PD_2]
MKFASTLLMSVLVSAVYATPADEALFRRAIGSKCNAPDGQGSCQKTGNCKGIAYSEPLCPHDPNDVQCCVEQQCSTAAGSGLCRSLESGCPGGHFDKGSGPNWPCPGGDDIQCCIQGAAPPGDGSLGQKVLDKALTAAGVPYAWGGGDCNGPTDDRAPWDYGEIGYDCSGLIAWAICQVTGRDLIKEKLRNTKQMFCAPESTLGYKKYPFSERKAGDAVFFGDNCDCAANPDIHHVGLMMDSGDRMWNAPNDEINQVQENSVSGFGSHCPDVIRFE